MTSHDNDPVRSMSDPHVRRPDYGRSRSNMGWLVPVALVAVLAIGGLMIYSASDDPTSTGHNTPAATTKTAPAGPARIAPAPAPTPPAKTQ
jgi:hypothetical protein